MDTKECGLGFITPEFHDRHDTKAIRKTFLEKGIVFLQGCDEQKLVELTRRLGRIVKPRNEVSAGTGVTNIRCAPALEGKGYSSEELFFHTDRSGWDLPPRVLITTLQVQSATGGESLLADGQQIIAHIRDHEPQLYSLLTSAKYASYRADDGSFVPRPFYDAHTGILRLRFDDGIQLAPSLIAQLPTLRAVIYQHAFAAALAPGDAYIVDNHRFLHGRTQFGGARELLRVLAHPHAPRSVRTVLLDIDGTLCRAEALSVDAFFRCAADVAGMEITHGNTQVNLHGQTDVSLLRDILRFHGAPEGELDALVARFLAVHPRYLEASLAAGHKSTVCAGAGEMLAWLLEVRRHVAGELTVNVGLLTGNSRPNALLKLRAAGIDTDVFDLEISAFGDEHPTRLALLEHSVARLEARYGFAVSPASVTLVGDTPLDVECAKQGGCAVVAVATGNYSMQQLEALDPDLVVENLQDAKEYFGNYVFGGVE
ncbi:hypothetical protein EDC01DRAFT_721925 [Geopyxis carbonaria]|nr:hypothetical protein EDC01DRAFT_721925 [Geopyxis carbonaria]